MSPSRELAPILNKLGCVHSSPSSSFIKESHVNASLELRIPPAGLKPTLWPVCWKERQITGNQKWLCERFIKIHNYTIIILLTKTFQGNIFTRNTFTDLVHVCQWTMYYCNKNLQSENIKTSCWGTDNSKGFWLADRYQTQRKCINTSHVNYW